MMTEVSIERDLNTILCAVSVCFSYSSHGWASWLDSITHRLASIVYTAEVYRNWQRYERMKNRCQNIHHRPRGPHSSAEEINDMTDYEGCSLFELIKLLRSRNAKKSGRRAEPCALADPRGVNPAMPPNPVMAPIQSDSLVINFEFDI